MASGAGGVVGGFEGRKKHLGQLAKVFHNRHGTWSDFGQFLKVIFGEASESTIGAAITSRLQGGVPLLKEIDCRHNPPSGRHSNFLQADSQALSSIGFNPLVSHERYHRPCVTMGSFDKDKNPGLVTHDLCIKALRFLRSIGKGDPGDATGRDRTYDDELNPTSSPLTTVSTVAESYSSIQSSNVLDRTGPRDTKRVRLSGMGDESFEDSDVEEVFLNIAKELGDDVAGDTVAEDPTDSEDSLYRDGQLRRSTKMRVATLAYLCNFADQPDLLRREFRRLREDPELYVLHLCGCGLCLGKSDSGIRIGGCCEKTHLKLGSAVENSRHRTFHETIRLAVDDDYPTLVGIVHRSVGGDGVF
ncbi:hypothetical protein F4815DRAFT_447187 [Daldinia loculata]|nr:hypothetical protein F4815DRAFT_447184 [Daldinia loculata]KAI2778473.1 hypothetical protein F4815DRAFT_447187 [Daldinia loculata]